MRPSIHWGSSPWWLLDQGRAEGFAQVQTRGFYISFAHNLRFYITAGLSLG